MKTKNENWEVEFDATFNYPIWHGGDDGVMIKGYDTFSVNNELKAFIRKVRQDAIEEHRNSITMAINGVKDLIWGETHGRDDKETRLRKLEDVYRLLTPSPNTVKKI